MVGDRRMPVHSAVRDFCIGLSVQKVFLLEIGGYVGAGVVVGAVVGGGVGVPAVVRISAYTNE